HELDVAFELTRATGTANALIEFLEYDRSIVLDSLGENEAARASYRRYQHLIAAQNRASRTPGADTGGTAPPRVPLEPYFLKRADRYILERLRNRFTIADLAKHCGVGWRTLETAFSTFRGVSPVSYIRTVRLDHAHAELMNASSDAGVTEVAARYG